MYIRHKRRSSKHFATGVTVLPAVTDIIQGPASTRSSEKLFQYRPRSTSILLVCQVLKQLLTL